MNLDLAHRILCTILSLAFGFGSLVPTSLQTAIVIEVSIHCICLGLTETRKNPNYLDNQLFKSLMSGVILIQNSLDKATFSQNNNKKANNVLTYIVLKSLHG